MSQSGGRLRSFKSTKLQPEILSWRALEFFLFILWGFFCSLDFIKYNEGMEKCDCFKKVPGCIRVQQPKCPFVAVIPTVTVEDISGLKELADCFVHVLNINTTYYIDDKHRIITVWQGPVETTVPEDVQTEEQFEEFIKSFGLRSQYLYVKIHDNNQDVYQAFFFDKTGTGYYYGELYPIDNGGLI